MTGRLADLLARLRRRSARDLSPLEGAADPLFLRPDREELDTLPEDVIEVLLEGEEQRARSAATLAGLRNDRAAAPDLSGGILSEVERRRGLLSRDGLRRVMVWRHVAAASLVIAAAGAFVAQRWAPERLSLTSRAAPIGDLVECVPGETAGALSGVRTAMDSLRRIARPAPPAFVVDVSRGRGCRGDDWVPAMNPRVAAVLWVDAPGPRRASCPPTCCPRPAPRVAAGVAPDQVSVRSLLLEPGRASTGEVDRAVVYLGR